MSTKDTGGAARRILVVDDHPVNLKLVCELLQSEGYEVSKAADADEALAAIDGARPDLILMDIALPGMDGLTLTRKIKEEGRCPGVPIVALTAFAMKGDAEKAADAGCDGYLSKPIDTRRFPGQVAAFFDRAQPDLAPDALKVLVIEDDAVDLKLVAAVLSTGGLVVQQRHSADGAVEAVVADPPDVVLLDIRLPGVDGRDLARRLRSDPRTSSIPIVAVTAYPSVYSPEELREAGCDLCIVKPIDTRELPRTLGAVVQRRPPRAGGES
jgi:two-component system cell cycle response regulator